LPSLVKLTDVRIILRDFEPTSLPIHAVYPSRRLVPTKVRVMIEFLASEFRLDPLLSDRGFGHPALSNSHLGPRIGLKVFEGRSVRLGHALEHRLLR
jgi:hypothetical protein